MKPGRPTRRTRTVPMRLSEREHEILKDRAFAAGMMIAEFARQISVYSDYEMSIIVDDLRLDEREGRSGRGPGRPGNMLGKRRKK